MHHLPSRLCCCSSSPSLSTRRAWLAGKRSKKPGTLARRSADQQNTAITKFLSRDTLSPLRAKRVSEAIHHASRRPITSGNFRTTQEDGVCCFLFVCIVCFPVSFLFRFRGVFFVYFPPTEAASFPDESLSHCFIKDGSYFHSLCSWA